MRQKTKNQTNLTDKNPKQTPFLENTMIESQ